MRHFTRKKSNPNTSYGSPHDTRRRLANKMANAFKEVNEDIQKLGAVADDEHIGEKMGQNRKRQPT